MRADVRRTAAGPRNGNAASSRITQSATGSYAWSLVVAATLARRQGLGAPQPRPALVDVARASVRVLPTLGLLVLVMGGIVWEDAKPQLASKAFLVHQPMGRGQLIAFAEDPNYRAYAEATELLFINAVLLGPGR